MKCVTAISQSDKIRAFLNAVRDELAVLTQLSDEDIHLRAISKSWLGDLIMMVNIPDATLEPSSPEAQARLQELMGVEIVRDQDDRQQVKMRKVGKEKEMRLVTKVDLLTWAKILDECQKMNDEQIYAFCLGYSMAELQGVIYNHEAKDHFVKIAGAENAKKVYSGDMREFIQQALESYVNSGHAEIVRTSTVTRIKAPHWTRLVAYLTENKIPGNVRYVDWQRDGQAGAIYRDQEQQRKRKIKTETLRTHIASAMEIFNKTKSY